jgi:hypothetical protein
MIRFRNVSLGGVAMVRIKGSQDTGSFHNRNFG